MENKERLKRLTHGAAALSVSSECVEVILFGGCTESFSRCGDNTVLGFGMSQCADIFSMFALTTLYLSIYDVLCDWWCTLIGNMM